MIKETAGTVKQSSILLLSTIVFCAACGMKLKPNGLDDERRPIEVARYDRLQSRYLSTGDFSALQEMNIDYPVETRTLIERVLQIGEVQDPDISTRFLRFFQDSTLQVLMSDAEVTYADMKDINEQFNKGFKRLHEWLPDLPTPKVYAQIGALDQSVIIGDRSIGICLDKYLGVNYPLYQKYYSYDQRVTMTRSHIVPDGLLFYILSLYPMRNVENRIQMERDLHIGKVMWLVNKSLGQQIYKTRYISIVNRYMHRHPKFTVTQLMAMDDYSDMRPW